MASVIKALKINRVFLLLSAHSAHHLSERRWIFLFFFLPSFSLSAQIFWECLETRRARLWSCAAHCLTSSSLDWGMKNFSRSFLLGAEAIKLQTAVQQKPLRKQRVGSEDSHMGIVGPLCPSSSTTSQNKSTKRYNIQYKMGKMPR